MVFGRAGPVHAPFGRLKPMLSMRSNRRDIEVLVRNLATVFGLSVG